MIVKLFAPYLVVKEEKSYLFWIIAVILFGLINVWASTLISGGQNFKVFIEDGTGYTFAVSISIPQIAEIFIRLIVERRKRKESHFIGYKMCAIFLVIIFVIFICFLWVGVFKDHTYLQLIIVLFAIALSFYTYCINQMDQHLIKLGKYDDSKYEEYDAKEKVRVKTLDKESKELKVIKSKEGDISL